MKILFIIVTVFILPGATGWFFLKRRLRRMAGGVKIIIIMQRLHQFSADLKKQGAFTNDISHLCEMSTFKESFIVNGSCYQCALAAKSALFGDEGFMDITTDDIVIWIDREGKATPFNGPDSISP